MIVRDLPGGISLTYRPSVESNIGFPVQFSLDTVIVVYMAESAEIDSSSDKAFLSFNYLW